MSLLLAVASVNTHWTRWPTPTPTQTPSYIHLCTQMYNPPPPEAELPFSFRPLQPSRSRHPLGYTDTELHHYYLAGWETRTSSREREGQSLLQLSTNPKSPTPSSSPSLDPLQLHQSYVIIYERGVERSYGSRIEATHLYWSNYDLHYNFFISFKIGLN